MGQFEKRLRRTAAETGHDFTLIDIDGRQFINTLLPEGQNDRRSTAPRASEDRRMPGSPLFADDPGEAAPDAPLAPAPNGEGRPPTGLESHDRQPPALGYLEQPIFLEVVAHPLRSGQDRVVVGHRDDRR